MKLAIATAAALLAASSFAFAADNNGGSNNGGNNGTKDNMTTGSTTKDGTGDLEDQQKCREGTGGGAPCQENGTTMDMQQ